MLQRFLPVWLILLSAIAFWWPEITTRFDPFLDPKNAIPEFLNIIFAVAMFAIGSLLKPDEVANVFQRWPRVFLGTGAQYIIMPVLAWGLALLLPLSDDAKIGLVLAGSVPGAMASNILTLQARGNVSYSVSLTTVATLLSPFVVPLVLVFSLGSVLSGDTADLQKYFDPVQTGVKLLWTVALPVVAGHLLARTWEGFARFSSRVSAPLANVVILWIIAVIVALNRNNFEVQFALLAAFVLLNGVGYLSGYGTGKLFGLDEGMRRALTLEIGMQNAGLGSVLAQNLFPDRPAAAIPTVLYMFGCMLTGTLLAAYWRRKGVEG